jgi:hypothetical protein
MWAIGVTDAAGGPELMADTAGAARAEHHLGKIGTPRRGLTMWFPGEQRSFSGSHRHCYVIVSQSAGNALGETGTLRPVGRAKKSGTEAGFMCRPSTCYPAAKN